MRESKVEQSVIVWCVSKGVYTRKFASPAHRGVPDRFFAKNGHACFLEFKAPRKKPTDLQLRELAMLTDHGVPASWTDNYHEAVAFLRRSLWI